MDTRELQLFVDVVNARSFSKAARAAGVAQSVVSEAISRLETQFNAQLISRTRSRKPLEVTPAGQLFLKEAKDILAGVLRLNDRMNQLRDKVMGPVRVAAIYSVGLLQLSYHVREFERQFPDAVLQVQYQHPNSIVDLVLSDKVDLGLMSFAPPTADLEIIPWQNQEMVVAVGPQHSFAGRKSIRTKELRGETMVTYCAGLPIRDALDQWLKAAGVELDPGTQEFDNIECLKRAVEIGAGIAVVPRAMCQREIELRSLQVLSLDDASWVRPLSIVRRREKPTTTAVQRFIRLLCPQSELVSTA